MDDVNRELTEDERRFYAGEFMEALRPLLVRQLAALPIVTELDRIENATREIYGPACD